MDPATAAATVVTVANAFQVLSVALDIAQKAQIVLSKGNPQTIEEELQRLEAARLRPSADIIAEADAVK